MDQGQGRLQKCQEAVEEVLVIMGKNADRVQEREYNLEELDEKAEALRRATLLFQKTTSKLRRKMGDQSVRREDSVWRRKWKVIVPAVVITALVVLVIAITVGIKVTTRDKGEQDSV